MNVFISLYENLTDIILSDLFYVVGRYVYAEVSNPLDPDLPQTSRLTSTFYGPPDGPCEINYW